MKLIFVRHGETAYNKLSKRLGWLDEPLNEVGLKQAEELADQIENNFDIIFSSPLKRASKTAEIIARKFNKKVVFSEYLKERNFGSLAGTVWKEGEKESIKYDDRPHGGESVEDVKTRLGKFLDELKSYYANKTVLVVTHGGIIKLMHYLNRKEETGHIKNISIHEFDI